MDCKTFTFVDVNAHQPTFDTFDKMLAIFLLKFLQCACKGMFCKTLPSVCPGLSYIVSTYIKGFQTRSSFLVPDKKTFMQRRETEKMHSHLTISNNLSATKFQFGFLHSRFHLLAHSESPSSIKIDTNLFYFFTFLHICFKFPFDWSPCHMIYIFYTTGLTDI